MTQLQCAQQIVGLFNLPKLRKIWKGADDLLNESQNKPPDGAADGSMSANQYNALRQVQKAIRELGKALEAFNQSLGV